MVTHSVSIKRGWVPKDIKHQYDAMKVPPDASGFTAFRAQTRTMVKVLFCDDDDDDDDDDDVDAIA